MTTHAFADTLRRIADALEKMPEEAFLKEKPAFTDEHQIVAIAAFWGYLRDLFTGTPKDVFTREEILVLLETIGRDTEMFPAPNLIEQIAELED